MYSKSRVTNFVFLKILRFGCCHTGIFTDFEILDVFQRTGLFFIEKKQTKFGFFLSENLTQKMHMSRILTFITNFCSSDEGL